MIFYENVIKNALCNENDEILNLKVDDCCDPGDHYVGILKQMSLTLRARNESKFFDVVIKYGKDSDRKDMFFIKEIDAYNVISTDITQWQKETYGTLLVPMKFPRILHGSIEKKLLIMENLKSLGYKMGDRAKGLNFEESTLVMKAIAEFHALCNLYLSNIDRKAFFERYPYFIDKEFEFPLTDEIVKSAIFDTLVPILSKAYPKEIPLLEDFNFERFQMALPTNVKKLCSPNEQFNVLCHGDLYTNNILFKYDERCKPTDLRFIDLQAVRLCTPAYDLIHFFWLSADSNVLANKQEELLEIYWQNFISVAKQIKLEHHYTRNDLQNDVKLLNGLGFQIKMKTILYSTARKEDALYFDESESLMTEAATIKMQSKGVELARLADDFVKEKIMVALRYGKKLQIF